MSGSLAVHEDAATSALRELFGELGDLKRTHSAGRTGSFASRSFSAAWSALAAGQNVSDVMHITVASALCAARLGDLDEATLEILGLNLAASTEVLTRAFDAVAVGVDPGLATHLRRAIGSKLEVGAPPPLVAALNTQPRAGATCPGKARILLEPPENHGEHCWAVAVFGVLLAPNYDADPDMVFLAGLAHHLHNALMPDSGFTGEMLLGDKLATLSANASAQVLDQLARPLRERVERVRRILADVATPEGRAFHAADVIDRVMQLAQHLRVAAVTMPMLLDDWQLVHAGPVKSFHDMVLRKFGLP